MRDVRAAAGSEVEVANVDQAQFVAFGGRQFAQAELPCFVARHEADVDRAVLEDDLVGQALGGFDLLFRQRRRVEIDGAVVVGHVERDRRHVVQADEGGGEHVLSGVLLHVVATAGGVDLAVDAGSGLEGFSLDRARGFEVVHDSAVFHVGDFGDAELGVGVGGDPVRCRRLGRRWWDRRRCGRE